MSSINVPPSSRITPSLSVTTKPTMTDLPVEALPESAGGKPLPQKMEAEVKNYDAQKQIVTLQTPSGDVSVRIPVPLKPGTTLQLEISTENGKTTATLTPQKTDQPATPPPARQIEPPVKTSPQPNNLPPFKTGDTTQGLFIPNHPAVTPAVPGGTTPFPVALSPAQAAIIVEQLKLKDLTSLPKPLADAAARILTAQNPAAALSSLPQDIQEQMTQLATPPKPAQTPTPAASNEAAVTPIAAPLPENDDQAIAAVLTGRVNAQTPLSSPLAPLQNALGMLKALLPFLQTAIGPGELPYAPITPHVILTPEQQLEHNTYSIKIVSVQPPSMQTPELSKMTPALPHPVDLPDMPTPQNSPWSAPTALTGIVDSLTPEGAPVLKMADGFLMLRESGPLPVGSRVTFDMSAPPVIPPAVALLTSNVPLLPLSGFSWPSLDAAIQVLIAASPDLAQAIRQTIPDASPKFVAAALFFMAALKTGNLANWLGDDMMMTLHNAARKGLVDRLAEDFRTLSRQNATTSGEWRGLSMPLMQDDQVTMMQLFMRQQPLPQDDARREQDREDDASSPQKMTRFILNLHLSRMGDVQMDGLVKAQTMDMILRTSDRLPSSTKQELLQAYARGMGSAGMEGSLIFQTKAQNWIDVKNPT